MPSDDEGLLNIILDSQSILVKMLITLKLHGIFKSNLHSNAFLNYHDKL